jgi:hypothetical protein
MNLQITVVIDFGCEQPRPQGAVRIVQRLDSLLIQGGSRETAVRPAIVNNVETTDHATVRHGMHSHQPNPGQGRDRDAIREFQFPV